MAGWSLGKYRQDSSMPGTIVSPGGRAASTAAQPAVVSWSVSATTSRPAAAAVAISSAGRSVPSDTEEWVCRSMRTASACRTGIPRARSGQRWSVPVAAGDRHGVVPAGRRWGWRAAVIPGPVVVADRVGGEVGAEHQLGQPLVDGLGVRQERDHVQPLLLSGGLEPEGA